MNVPAHIVASAAAGVAVYSLTGSPETGTALFLAGWAVDLDHALDFTRQWGFREALVRMARMGMRRKDVVDRAYLIFHAYEISALLWLLAAFFPDSPWLLGLAAGHLFHLLLDQLTNVRGLRPAYFLSYRAIHRFSRARTFGPEDREAPLGLEGPPFQGPVAQEVFADIPPEEEEIRRQSSPI